MVGITGGSGYVGSWLAQKFLEKGEKVRIIDIAPLPKMLKNKVEYMNIDINDKKNIIKGIEGCNVFYHLAAVVSKLRGFEDRYYCVETNISGTLNILEACKKEKVNRVIYMGTSEILGEPLSTPTDERHPRKPKTTYGITKCAAEDLCYEYFLTYGLNVLMPRLYMVYGIDDWRPIKYHNVIVKFVWNVLNNKTPVVYKDCIRSFLYITDCVDVLYLLKNKGTAGEVYDICDRPEYAVTMEELAYKIIKLCGKKIKPIIKDPPPTDTKVKLPSGYKAYAELGWCPQVSLNDGLEKVVEWIKKEGLKKLNK